MRAGMDRTGDHCCAFLWDTALRQWVSCTVMRELMSDVPGPLTLAYQATARSSSVGQQTPSDGAQYRRRKPADLPSCWDSYDVQPACLQQGGSRSEITRTAIAW